MTLTIEWLPMIVRDPLPFAAALWSRLAEIGVTNVFVTIVFVAAILFEEINDRAEELNLDNNDDDPSEDWPMKLEELKFHHNLACELIEKINHCFGAVLLLEITLGFTVPIFDFYKMIYTKGLQPRFYFEFLHTSLRFLIFFLIPSHTVTQQVFTN